MDAKGSGEEGRQIRESVIGNILVDVRVVGWGGREERGKCC